MGKRNPDRKTTKIGYEFTNAQAEKLRIVVAKGKEESLSAIVGNAVKKYMTEKWGVKL